jgi:hypothetical protein
LLTGLLTRLVGTRETERDVDDDRRPRLAGNRHSSTAGLELQLSSVSARRSNATAAVANPVGRVMRRCPRRPGGVAAEANDRL